MAAAYQNIWKSITGMPEVSLDGKRYCFVKQTATGGIAPSIAGDWAIGITQEPNDVGQPTQVAAQGELFVVLGGTVASGDVVMSDANGAAVKYVEGTGVFPLGICRVGGAAGDIGTVLIC